MKDLSISFNAWKSPLHLSLTKYTKLKPPEPKHLINRKSRKLTLLFTSSKNHGFTSYLPAGRQTELCFWANKKSNFGLGLTDSKPPIKSTLLVKPFAFTYWIAYYLFSNTYSSPIVLAPTFKSTIKLNACSLTPICSKGKCRGSSAYY